MTIHKNNNNRLMTFSLRQIPILNLKLIIKINNKTIMLKMKTLNIKAVTMSNNNKNNLLIQRKKKKKKSILNILLRSRKNWLIRIFKIKEMNNKYITKKLKKMIKMLLKSNRKTTMMSTNIKKNLIKT